tara:strand:+ start:5877 stop:6371 length:495 start_codon:yes stop_codon:yes gene_type:complete
MITRANTRSSQLRENNIKQETEYTFEEPNALQIPTAVEERYASEGISLGWLRITLKGQEDYAHIGRKMQEGWQFVDSDEVPEMGATSIVRDEGRYKGAVCRGDLALGKIPTGRIEARKAHYKNKADKLMEAVNSQLMRGNNSRMPISNSSKTQTIRGRTPKFQE